MREHAHICASRAQYDMVIAQVGDVPFIEEPSRRDTFPAIALAATHLIAVGTMLDEVVIVMPIDHMVDDQYYTQLSTLDTVIQESGAEMALMGVRPTEPTNKFGYIKRSVQHDEWSDQLWQRVEAFVEKPTTNVARDLITQGALWNCGVFAFKLGYLINVLETRGWPTEEKELRKAFHLLPKRSFDYEVVEQAESVVVLPYHGMWKDLGSWESLSEELEEPLIGKGNVLQCENTQVINELGIPVVAMGLKDAVVVASPDGILVTEKQISTQLKTAIENFDDRPMYEERLWGYYRVLDYQKLDDDTEVLTRWIELLPGRHLAEQRHKKRSEHWTMVSGSGIMVIEGESKEVKPGDVIRIEANTWHALKAVEKLTFIEVQRGSELTEEDIERRELDWDAVFDKDLPISHHKY